MYKTDPFIKYAGLNDDYSLNLIGDTWVINRVKTTSDRFIDLQANASLIPKIWHGEPEIADHIVIPNWEDCSQGTPSSLMFDDDMDTFWLAEGYFTGAKKVVVTFKVSSHPVYRLYDIVYILYTHFIGV